MDRIKTGIEMLVRHPKQNHEEVSQMAVLIVFVVLIIAVVIFSAQNSTPVAVSLLFWRFEASVALVIFFSVFVGMLLGGIMVSLRRLMKPSPKKKDHM